MPRHRFSVTARSTAPPERLFATLADVPGWPRWMLARRAELEREGVPAPGGVGAIRRLGGGPFSSREEITEYDPPRHLGYRVVSGLPVRDYRADVDFTGDDRGTTITWAASFEPAMPGTGAFLRWVLRQVIRSVASGLARDGERPNVGG
jgi:uncharacterized protein YndB with AHSA1/START domain